MAATPSRPNDYLLSTENQHDIHHNDKNNNNSKNKNKNNDNKEEDTTKLRKSSCSNCQCTNISIMQLFHEMKQEFPKIPDHVVSQCVIDNCHNRNACIDNLQKENISLLQIYPTHLLMRQNNQGILNNNIKFNEHINNNVIKLDTTKKNINHNNNTSDKKESDMLNLFSNCKNPTTSKSSSALRTADSVTGAQSPIQNNHIQRPSTLNISKEPYKPIPAFSRTGNRPTRSAPPIPPLSTSSSSSSLNSSSSQIQQQKSLNSSQSPTSSAVVQYQNPLPQTVQSPQQQPSSLLSLATTPPQPSNDSFVSVNVTVSPVSSRPPPRPARHTSALNIQPETPFFRDIQPNSRSYTSVHFNLRPPSDNPQSPINISAGPPLTYSSSSFDARQGHQNQLQITIGGGGGSISAMRARPRNYYNETNGLGDDGNGQIDSVVELFEQSMDNSDDAHVVRNQLLRKERLATELENDKKRLDLMNREIIALQAPLPAGGYIRLVEEIERLQCECRRMAQEVEEAGVYVIGETNEAFYRNISTIQRIPVQTRPPRPPRPPPPVRNNHSIQQSGSGGFSISSSSLVSNNCSSTVIPTLLNNNNINNFSNNNINFNNNTINNDNINNTEDPWTCSVCTFQNHPLLDTCEQCDMIKFKTDNNNGGTGTIKITGAHFSPRIQDMHLLQSSPRLTTSSTSFSPAS